MAVRNGDPLVVQRDWSPDRPAESVGYHGAHKRIRRIKGSASRQQCVHCGGAAREWAYDHSDLREISESLMRRGAFTSLVYSMSPDHYIPLCRPCHLVFDREPVSGTA